MLLTCCILIKLCLISSAVGILNVDYMSKHETETKLADLENNINKKNNVLESSILDKLITYIDGKANETNIKISSAVGILNVDYMSKHETERKLADLENNINKKNNVLESSILDKLITYIDGKANETNIKIPEIENKITQIFNASINKLEVKLEEQITRALNASNKKIEELLEKRITETSNELESMKNEVFNKFRKITAQLPCKEVSVNSKKRSSPSYSIDSSSFNNVMVNRSSTGRLTYFETHIAVRADKYVYIQLSNTEKFSESPAGFSIEIGRFSNEDTMLDIYSGTKSDIQVKRVSTHGILSSVQFKAFYLKIVDGKLEFGKEGESPLITHSDGRISEVKYLRFKYDSQNEANIRYDCPVPFEGTS